MRETTTNNKLSETWSEGEVSLTDSLTDQTSCYTWRKLRLRKGSEMFPRSRSKHGACRLGDYAYLYGGSDYSWSLKDLWRYSFDLGTWESLSYRGDKLPHLEDFTMLAHGTLLYIFGGDFNPSLDDTPLWIYHTDLYYVRKVCPEPGQPHPTGRRDHSAVVYGDAMFVFGGFDHLKGSLSDFWRFEFDSESWDLVIPEKCRGEEPCGRHGHSAVIYDKSMWIYGGMTDLIPKQELWTFSFVKNQWGRIRTKLTPPALIGHTANVIGDSMFVLGGESAAQPQDSMWRFRFENLTWERVEFASKVIPPVSRHCTALILPPVSTVVESEPNRSVSLPALRRQSRQTVGLSVRPGTSPAGSVSRSQQLTNSGAFHNKISPKSSIDQENQLTATEEHDDQVMAAKSLGNFKRPSPKREVIELSTFVTDNVPVDFNDKKPLILTDPGAKSTDKSGADNLTYVPSPPVDGVLSLSNKEAEARTDASVYVDNVTGPPLHANSVSRPPQSTKPTIQPTDTKSNKTNKKHLEILRLEDSPKRRSFSADDLVIEDLEMTGELVSLFDQGLVTVDQKVALELRKQIADTNVVDRDFEEAEIQNDISKGSNSETSFSTVCIPAVHVTGTDTSRSPSQTSSGHDSVVQKSPERAVSYIQHVTASVYVFGGKEMDRRDLQKKPISIWQCRIPLIS